MYQEKEKPNHLKKKSLKHQQKNHTKHNQIIQNKVNNTGLPDTLKSNMETLSGCSMNDVKVHYNSSKPAQLQARAYAEGTDIHLGPGQDKHLPHEAWHIVQQKQGRVRSIKQLKSSLKINDDTGLEREADIMGARANTAVGTTSNPKTAKTHLMTGMPEVNFPMPAVTQLKLNNDDDIKDKDKDAISSGAVEFKGDTPQKLRKNNNHRSNPIQEENNELEDSMSDEKHTDVQEEKKHHNLKKETTFYNNLTEGYIPPIIKKDEDEDEDDKYQVNEKLIVYAKKNPNTVPRILEIISIRRDILKKEGAFKILCQLEDLNIEYAV